MMFSPQAAAEIRSLIRAYTCGLRQTIRADEGAVSEAEQRHVEMLAAILLSGNLSGEDYRISDGLRYAKNIVRLNRQGAGAAPDGEAVQQKRT